METQQEKKPAATRSLINSKEYKEVMQQFPQIIQGLNDPLKQFKRNCYEDAFEEYKEQFKGLFSNLQLLYYVAEAEGGKDAQEELLEALSDRLISVVVEELNAITLKSRQKKETYNKNMILVTFSIPLIMANKTDYCKSLANKISDKWTEHYPTLRAGVATFEEINGGFGHKWCYITTAVCQSLGKDDNCMELKSLRDYRDGYLANQPDGLDVIKEYYDIAPSIVKHIDKREDSKAIYQTIFEHYLVPCLTNIKENKMEACKYNYMKMVNELKQEYFITE